MAKVSGFQFQYEVEERISRNEWKTITDQSYIDDVENKPRSVDIVATREAPSPKSRGTQLALVIEVKFLTEESSVVLRDNPKDKKSYFIDGFWSQDLEYALDNFHLFSTPRVARNISNGDLSGAVFQTMKALFYLRTKTILNQAGLFYPLVVYKGKRITDQNGEEMKNFLYYQTYEWQNPETKQIHPRALYVDVVHESSLEEYLENVYKKEFSTLMQVIYFRQRMEENRIEKNRQDRRNSAM